MSRTFISFVKALTYSVLALPFGRLFDANVPFLPPTLLFLMGQVIVAAAALSFSYGENSTLRVEDTADFFRKRVKIGCEQRRPDQAK